MLAELLSEPVAEAVERRSRAFDLLAGGAETPIVLYGAGGLGRRVLAGLRALGRAPLALADRRAAALGGAIDGVPVLLPEEAVGRFGDRATFVVSIWNAQTDHRYPETRAALQSLGAVHVAPALALFWKYPETFLPYYCLDTPERLLEHADAVRRLDDLLADPLSREVLRRQLRWRLRLDFEALPEPVAGAAYFQPDLVPLAAEEVFVDCGAYDGDSLRPFLELTAGTDARAIAIEPDPRSYARLEACIAGLPERDRRRVRAVETAVGRRRERLRFDGSGAMSAGVDPAGSIEVACAPLDEILAAESPTYVKMDLEGAEGDALAGGEGVIRRSRPAMAVCVYHRPEDLWRLPLKLHELLPAHALHLRPHGHEGWDLVAYAVNPGRS